MPGIDGLEATSYALFLQASGLTAATAASGQKAENISPAPDRTSLCWT
jgi:hypothetical protein